MSHVTRCCVFQVLSYFTGAIIKVLWCEVFWGDNIVAHQTPTAHQMQGKDLLIRMCALFSWATCSMRGLAKPALPSSLLVVIFRSRILWGASYGRLHPWSSSFGMLVHGGLTWISVLLVLHLANPLVWSCRINVCNARCIRPALATTFTRCSKGRSTANSSRRWSIAQSWPKNIHGNCVKPWQRISRISGNHLFHILSRRSTCSPANLANDPLAKTYSLETPSTKGNRFESSRCRVSAQTWRSQAIDWCGNGSRCGSSMGSTNPSPILSLGTSQCRSAEGHWPGVSWSSEGKPRSWASVGGVVSESGRLSTGVRSVTSEDRRPPYAKAPSRRGRWSTSKVGCNKQHCLVSSVRSWGGISWRYPCCGSLEWLPHCGRHLAIQSMASLWERADDRLPSRASSKGLGYSSQDCSKSQRYPSIRELDQDLGGDHGRCSRRLIPGIDQKKKSLEYLVKKIGYPRKGLKWFRKTKSEDAIVQLQIWSTKRPWSRRNYSCLRQTPT